MWHYPKTGRPLYTYTMYCSPRPVWLPQVFFQVIGAVCPESPLRTQPTPVYLGLPYVRISSGQFRFQAHVGLVSGSSKCPDLSQSKRRERNLVIIEKI
ncbi:hypothetical protein AVEN_227139-1 [Araneus ventricosus]|uniref:Uncharacterized protein n=1 Tax=Araneus ventricosus TaxID=182803 RepID=A0A4Y2BWQ4_ARAVE|nr:hypothetical protein AVEN_227139-1 [Araneus ventricosus]